MFKVLLFQDLEREFDNYRVRESASRQFGDFDLEPLCSPE
jgi:hypothetical protein